MAAETNEISKEAKQWLKEHGIKIEDVIVVSKGGKVQLDFNNPKHLETYRRWVEED